MKLEVGKSYRTRDGRKATVKTLGGEDLAFPVYAEVDGYLESYTDNGLYYGDVKSGLDLIDDYVVKPEHPKEDFYGIKPLDVTVKSPPLEANKEKDRVATLSADTIDQIAVDSLLWHFYEYGELEPLQKEAFRIVLSYYGKQV